MMGWWCNHPCHSVVLCLQCPVCTVFVWYLGSLVCLGFVLCHSSCSVSHRDTNIYIQVTIILYFRPSTRYIIIHVCFCRFQTVGKNMQRLLEASMQNGSSLIAFKQWTDSICTMLAKPWVYTYKLFHNLITLVGMVNAHYRVNMLWVDGHNDDAGIPISSTMSSAMENNTLNITPQRASPGQALQFPTFLLTLISWSHTWQETWLMNKKMSTSA